MTYHKKLEPVLILNLTSSPRLNRLLMLLHLLALIACVANALAMPIKILIFVTVMVHGYWLKQQLLKPQPVIQHSSEQGWQIDGQPMQINASTVISTLAIFLHYTVAGKRQHLLIANDALNTDGYRQLIVRLKTTYKATDS